MLAYAAAGSEGLRLYARALFPLPCYLEGGEDSCAEVLPPGSHSHVSGGLVIRGVKAQILCLVVIATCWARLVT